jgi:hypothetical protein
MVVEVVTDLTPTAVGEIDEVDIAVQTMRGAQTWPFAIKRFDDFPVVLGLLPAQDRRAALTLTATGFRGGNFIVTQTKRTCFVPGQARKIKMSLGRGCESIGCPADETCERGDCVSPDQPSNTLDGLGAQIGCDDTPGDVDGGGEGG